MNRSFVAALALALISKPATAIHPETGLYWSSMDPGRGMYLEVQGSTALAFFYAFDRESGAAKFYVASGEVRDTARVPCVGLEAPFGAEAGYYPLHSLSAPLFEVQGGQPIVAGARVDREETSQQIGLIGITFHGAAVAIADIAIMEGGARFCDSLTRFSFGEQEFFSPGMVDSVLHDVTGEWVFVDKSDPVSSPLRFSFDERIPAELPSIIDENFWSQTQIATYRDVTRGAEFRCASRPLGNSGDLQNSTKTPGCELYVDGQIVLSAKLSDVGRDRIEAFRGTLPAAGVAPYRRSERLIGLRVRDFE